MNRRYKIAYVSYWDPNNKLSWSGTLYSMKQALGNHGSVEWINVRSKLLLRITDRLVWSYSYIVKLVTGKEYNWTRSLFLSYVRGFLIKAELDQADYDFIFAPVCSNEIAFLKTEIPIIYLSDSTFFAYNKLYKTTKNSLNVVQREANYAEKIALEKAEIVSLPSQWAIDSAVRDYDVPANKIHLNRFGSNFQSLDPSRQIKKLDSCRIFFLGVDWLRKGGDIVVETCDHLVARGMQVELTICGCELPVEYMRDYITHISFLDKNQENDEKRLIELFDNAHFFFMPSQGECYGIVYAEASSAGVPSIACDTGGVASVVTEKNGCLLPKGSTPEDYAEVIESLFKQEEKYYELSKSARLFYEEKLDWSVWSNEIIDAFNSYERKRAANNV